MILLKKNLKTGKVEEIGGEKAYDELCVENYGSLDNWDIFEYRDFVKFFESDLEDKIMTTKYEYSLKKEKTTLTQLNELKKTLEEIELFEDCISTRDSEEDVEEFQKYVKKCFKIVNKLIKKEEVS